MLKPEVWWNDQEGDRLHLVEVPWWAVAFEWLVLKLFSPDHGISGWLANRYTWFCLFVYNICNKVAGFVDRHKKWLYDTPIESGCKASIALWGRENHLCWHDECPAKEADAVTA